MNVADLIRALGAKGMSPEDIADVVEAALTDGAVKAAPSTYERAKQNDDAVRVYVMVSRANGDVKIGISQHPNWRRKALSAEWRGDLALVWTSEPYSRSQATDIERRAHGAMANSRLEGEWFACSPEDAIAAVKVAEGVA